MNAKDKEIVYDELRSYHLNVIPEKLSTETMNNYRIEFGLIEDKVVSMLLQLVNGKTAFVDHSKEIESFEEKVKLSATALNENHDRSLLSTKMGKLKEIVALAKLMPFELRKLRPKKIAKR
ncbi:MAG TPA: hypothetical protein VD998_04335 [Verrucomicrobiae bacterium]|nr:hypothetical protein [Verrucomicrobiae bacterium]